MLNFCGGCFSDFFFWLLFLFFLLFRDLVDFIDEFLDLLGKLLDFGVEFEVWFMFFFFFRDYRGIILFSEFREIFILFNVWFD